MKILFVFMLCFSQLGFSEPVWDYVDRKLERKEFKKWSLANWFHNKDERGLQNQWLDFNTKNGMPLLELYADYAWAKFDRNVDDGIAVKTDGASSEFGLYWGALGVNYRIEDYEDFNQSELAFNLRLIGSSQQSTHLVATYGKRDFDDNDDGKFEQGFWGGDIALYLLPWIGFDARYRKYLKEDNENNSVNMESKRFQWGAFIDIHAFRIFAYQFEEDLERFPSSGAKSKLHIKGTAFGVRLYF